MTERRNAQPWGELVSLVGGELLIAHAKNVCDPRYPCAIHRPSAHALSKFSQHWREDRALLERICHHGVGHPDPDALNHSERAEGKAAMQRDSVHACCGCCIQETP